MSLYGFEYGSVSGSGQTRVADFSQQVSPAKYRIEAQEFPLGEPEFGMRPLVSCARSGGARDGAHQSGEAGRA